MEKHARCVARVWTEENILHPAMTEEAWYNKRWNDKQQRDMQEAATLGEELVEVTGETAMNRQRTRERTSGKTSRKDDDGEPDPFSL